MEIKSQRDTTLFFWNLAFFMLLAFIFSIPIWKTNYFEKVADGSTKYIFLGVGFLVIFVAFPLWALSWTLTKFIVSKGQITVTDWFGIRKKTYSLQTRESLKVKSETAPYRFRYFPIDSRYNEFKKLYLTTNEGRKLRIQSRYYKNFEQLNVAIRKASVQ